MTKNLQNKDVRLIELHDRAREFLKLEVAPSQVGFVATVAQSYADALFPSGSGDEQVRPWLRGVLVGDQPAGFVMCAEPTPKDPDPTLWRLLIDAKYQGRGLGRFAVESVLQRYREQGCQRVLVGWCDKIGNAGEFYRKLGFVETGVIEDGEVIAEYVL